MGLYGRLGRLTADWTADTAASGVVAVADEDCPRDTMGVGMLGDTGEAGMGWLVDEEDIVGSSRSGIWRSRLATAVAAAI